MARLLVLILALPTLSAAVRVNEGEEVKTLSEEHAGTRVGMFGSTCSTSFTSFDWAMGEEEKLGESQTPASRADSMLDSMLYLANIIDNANGKQVMGKADDKCINSLTMATMELVHKELKPDDFDTKLQEITQKICDQLQYNPSCCDDSSCDATLCWAEGVDQKFGNNNHMVIKVAGELEYIQGDVQASVSKASLCIKTGIESTPLECIRDKKCENLQYTIEKACSDDSYAECLPDGGGRGFKKVTTDASSRRRKRVNIAAEEWITAKENKAATLTAMICAAS